MQKIGIDCRFSGIATGLGRYTRELVPELVRSGSGVEWTLFVRSTEEAWLRELPENVRVLAADIPHYSWAEQTRWPKLIQQSGIDELFVPHFNVPFFCPVPFTVAVHDFILHAYPNQAPFLKRLAYRLLMKRAVSKASLIIAVSAFTAAELKKYYGEKISHKTRVVTEAVSEAFAPPSPEVQSRVVKKYQLPERYFLYVGNAKQHKNVPTLLQAFEKAKLPNTELLLVSPGPEADALALPSSVHRLAEVDDADLPTLYARAQAFVTASLYEGFCLPVLEARACGCPVIAANRSAIPELQASGVTLVEPTVEALATALAHFQAPEHIDPPTRTWQDVAEEVLAVLLTKKE